MDATRRSEIAQAVVASLPGVLAAVTESWGDLVPASTQWTKASQQRARAAARAALVGIVPLVEQGDLDEATWTRTVHTVHGQGKAGRDEVAELLRSVRVVGVELLTDELEARVGLTHAERWNLQREAQAYFDDLLGDDDEPETAAYAETLAELERSGPDLR